MARKVINYEEWVRTRALVEARARRILAFFDPNRAQMPVGEDRSAGSSDDSGYETQAGEEL